MASRLSGGLEKTFAHLAITRNQAVVEPLLRATDSPVREIRDAAFRALITQRHPTAEREILQRWPHLSHHWRMLLAERSNWLSHAIREAFNSQESEQVATACEAAIQLRDYELIPFFVSMCEDKKQTFPTEAGRVLLSLAESLSDELHAPRDYRNRTDPQQLRVFALGSLESATDRFQHHRRTEVLEAVLLLANRDTAAVKGILQAPCDRTFPALLEILLNSARPQVQKLLMSYLDDSSAPLAAIHAISRRDDITFLRQLCRRLSGELGPVVTGNLKRIESLAWLRDRSELWHALSDQEQVGAVQLVERVSIVKDLALDALTMALKSGGVSARRAAATALSRFQGAEANAVALHTLEDQDTEVRIAITKQLRERRSAGSLKALVAMLDSSHEGERVAAQQQLQEYTFARYLQAFETMDDETRKDMGRLVRKIDKGTVAALAAEMDAQTKHRRRRALEMIEILQLAQELEPQLQQMLNDEDSFLRYEAQRQLNELQEASNLVVKESAESAVVKADLETRIAPLPETAIVPDSSIGTTF